jgi:Bacterial transglutaminase-like N-terminal region
MTVLNVQHTTVYRYNCPVVLGDHRLMLRPRDSHDLRVINQSDFLATSIAWLDT